MFLFLWSFTHFHSSPNNLLTPPVLKWTVNKASPSLNDNEKLVFKLFLAKSIMVVKNGSGGFSSNGVKD